MIPDDQTNDTIMKNGATFYSSNAGYLNKTSQPQALVNFNTYS